MTCCKVEVSGVVVVCLLVSIDAHLMDSMVVSKMVCMVGTVMDTVVVSDGFYSCDS